MSLPFRTMLVSVCRLGMLCAFWGMISCTGSTVLDSFLNNTASLGGTVPGERGSVQVGFINNTPFRAIFTFGTYDPQDQNSVPEFDQFQVDADATLRLEGNSSSAIFTFTCGRVVGVGDSGLIARIQSTDAVRSNGEDINSTALEAGIAFSDRPLDDPDADQPTAGRSDSTTTLHGTEYQADSLLIYTFEVDANEPDGFRINLDVILP